MLDDWKIKISVLWLVAIGTFLAYIALMLLEPGVIGQVIAGEVGGTQIGQEVLMLFAIIALAPLTMAFLTLILRDSINRWANIIVSIAVMVVELAMLKDDLTQSKPYAFAILLGLAKVVVLALIVWYAWKSKQKA
jgi:hypothetical protein